MARNVAKMTEKRSISLRATSRITVAKNFASTTTTLPSIAGHFPTGPSSPSTTENSRRISPLPIAPAPPLARAARMIGASETLTWPRDNSSGGVCAIALVAFSAFAGNPAARSAACSSGRVERAIVVYAVFGSFPEGYPPASRIAGSSTSFANASELFPPPWFTALMSTNPASLAPDDELCNEYNT